MKQKFCWLTWRAIVIFCPLNKLEFLFNVEFDLSWMFKPLFKLYQLISHLLKLLSQAKKVVNFIVLNWFEFAFLWAFYLKKKYLWHNHYYKNKNYEHLIILFTKHTWYHYLHSILYTSDVLSLLINSHNCFRQILEFEYQYFNTKTSGLFKHSISY